MHTFKINDRAQWFTRGAQGTIAAVINGGMAYLFHADCGAKFTVHDAELSPIGAPDRAVVPLGDARVVFKVDPVAPARQRTPVQQQQSMDQRQRADLDRHITGNYGEDQLREPTAAHTPRPLTAKDIHAAAHRYADRMTRKEGDQLVAVAQKVLRNLRERRDTGMWSDDPDTLIAELAAALTAAKVSA